MSFIAQQRVDNSVIQLARKSSEKLYKRKRITGTEKGKGDKNNSYVFKHFTQ